MIVVDIDDVAVPVISPEDLLITKMLAGRPKDVEDIRGILYLRAASLDLAYIRRTLTTVEAALGQSDLQPLFEAELQRVSGSRGI